MIDLLNVHGEALYGLGANILPAPLSLFASIGLMLGLNFVGKNILRGLGLNLFEKFPWLRWQTPLIGGAVLLILIYPAALIGYFPRAIAQFLALTILLIGFIDLFIFIRNSYRSGINVLSDQLKFNIYNYFFLIYILGYTLIACGPITNADSLNYHLAIAIEVLNTGAFPFSPEWFHSRVSGGGETLIALGLSIGAEQFGSLYQLSGVVSISSYFWCSHLERNSSDQSRKWRNLVGLAVISSPVILFLVSSPKPQIALVAMTTLALMLTIYSLANPKELSNKSSLASFALICLLLMVAVISKMSFLISGTIIGMVSLVCIARRGLLVKAIPIGLIGVGVIIAPPVIWKHIQFGGSILEALTNPFPGNWPGTQSFLEFLKRYRDTNIIFPLSLILPANLGTITTTLGCGLVIALWNLLRSKNNKQWVLIFCATLVTIITIFFGQLTSRFFLEPYLWLSIAASIGLIAINRKLIYAVSTLVLIQSVIMLLPLFYGVVTLFPGSISNMLRDKVMHKNANGYAVMEWANSALPKSSTLISDTWLALSPRNTISNEWMIFTPTIDSDRQIYAKRVILKKPNFKLITTTSPQNSLPPDCMRSVYAGPFEYSDAQRNPFNKGAKKYAWLIKITNDVYLCERKN